MSTTKYFLFAALGVATVLLLTSDKAKEMRDDLENKAKENAKKWKTKLSMVGNNTADTLAELKELLNSEVEGLSADTRRRIENILNGTNHSAAKIKKSLSDQVAS